MDEFTEWLNSEIEKRGWSFQETGRRAGLSGTTISDILAGKTNPGFKFCRGIARAFKMQPEKVLRLAGLLPSISEEGEETEELLYYFDQLSRYDQKRLLAIARTLAEERVEYEVTPGRSAATTS